MENRICPFSFAFSIRKISPIKPVQGPVPVEVNIGFKCIGPKCVFWDGTAQQCSILIIRHLLEELAKEKWTQKEKE